jgi:dipeptidyl-peptidase 4
MRKAAFFLALALSACTPPGGGGQGPHVPTWMAPPSSGAPSSGATVLPESASPITVERMAKFPEPGWQIPRRIELAPDGSRATYLMSEKGDDEMVLWSLSLKSGERSVMLRVSDLAPPPAGGPSREEELRNERQRKRTKGITDYVWASKAQVLVIPSAGDVFVKKGDDAVMQLTTTKEPELDPKPCADGSRIAYVRGRELFVMDVGSKKETQLTSGAPEGVTRGQSDFVAQEEFEEPSGFFWSPDCKTIAYLEVDERRVAQLPVMGHRGGAPDLMMQRYPRAGADNPKTSLYLVDVTSKKSRSVSLPSGSYYGRFAFTPDAKWLVFFAVTRDQRKASLVRVEVKDGGSYIPFSIEAPKDKPGAWIEMPDLKMSPVGNFAFFTTERGGYTHVNRVELPSGTQSSVTDGQWEVTGIAGVDEEANVYVVGTKDEPIGRNLYRVSSSGRIERLTPEKGVHTVVVSSKKGLVADVHSAGDRPPKAIVLGTSGTHEIPIPRDPDFDALAMRTPETITVEAPNMPKLYGQILAPRNLQPGKQHPLLVYVYGGPASQSVIDRWSPRLFWQHLADRGFFVMQIDNRGGSGRGPAFAWPIAGELGKVELEDQLRALDHVLAKYPIDPERVGIYGHSYGGFMAALAMLKTPGRYKAGVAASPVTDWRLYDTGYTERYMRKPAENAAGYEATDLEKLAPNLKGELLIIHALMDENVHFQHTADLIDALVLAKKQFEMFVFPGERHGYRSPAAREHAAGLTTRFLVRTLGTPACVH